LFKTSGTGRVNKSPTHAQSTPYLVMKQTGSKRKNAGPMSPVHSDYVFNISGESKNVRIHHLKEKVVFTRMEYVSLIQSVDEEHVAKLATKFFNSVSGQNNFYVDEKELRKFYKSLDTTLMPAEAINKLVQKSMQEMDTDGDKKITLDEMKEFYIKRMQRGLLKDQITIDAIAQLVQSNNAGEVYQLADKVFRTIDQDDNKITSKREIADF
jgi:hypothetical protein